MKLGPDALKQIKSTAGVHLVSPPKDPKKPTQTIAQDTALKALAETTTITAKEMLASSKATAQVVEAIRHLSTTQLSQIQTLIEMIATRPETPSVKRMNVIRDERGLIDHVEFE